MGWFPLLLLLLGLGSVTCRPYENGTPSSDAVCAKEGGMCVKDPNIQQNFPMLKCCASHECGEDSKCIKAECTSATVVEKCGSNAQCSNHICTCDPGYVKESVTGNKMRCVDINECTSGNPCKNGGT